jgi:hypothetical protein
MAASCPYTLTRFVRIDSMFGLARLVRIDSMFGFACLSFLGDPLYYVDSSKLAIGNIVKTP